MGFVLIVTCIAMTLVLGFAALGVDLGRMYVIQSELQAFTDAAALSAATGIGRHRCRDRAGAAGGFWIGERSSRHEVGHGDEGDHGDRGDLCAG